MREKGKKTGFGILIILGILLLTVCIVSAVLPKCSEEGCDSFCAPGSYYCSYHKDYRGELTYKHYPSYNTNKTKSQAISTSAPLSTSAPSGTGSNTGAGTRSGSGSSTGSSRSTGSGSSHGSTNKNKGPYDSYDDGYDDVYDEDDYDWDRYESDDDYADGVDDAMDDLDY